ncbi:hypothetical protein B0H10DRAFT_1960476 [Mycena sp. CBHHK59/15]|nr:hypothetical protein B0H10DRAFT_1960476 [Mycena sp. CBHHK59/15]
MARTRQPRRNPVLERLRRIRNGIHQTRALLALGRSPYKRDGPGGVYIQLRLDPDNHHQLQAKYGHTKNFARRRQQYKKCEQNGHGLWFWGIVYSRHRMLAERIIHLVLAAQGRRARVVRCPGCGVNHREFFTVGAGGMVELEFWLWLGVALAGLRQQRGTRPRAPTRRRQRARSQASSNAPKRERAPEPQCGGRIETGANAAERERALERQGARSTVPKCPRASTRPLSSHASYQRAVVSVVMLLEHTANPQEKRKSKAKKKKGEDGDEDVQRQGQREGPRPDLQVHPGVHLRPIRKWRKVFVFDAAERAAERKSFGLLKDQLSAVLSELLESRSISGFGKGC